MKWVLIIITVLLTSYSQLILKWRLEQFPAIPDPFMEKLMFYFYKIFDPFIFTSFFAAFLGSLTYMMALNKLELTVAYPMMSLSYVLVIIASYFLMNEPINLSKVIGVICILTGVVLLAYGNANRI